MTTQTVPEVAPAPQGLEPLRTMLLQRASAQAQEIVAQARAEGVLALQAAEQQVSSRLRSAVEQGEADAQGVVAAQQSDAARSARADVLAAQNVVYLTLRERTAAVAAELLQDQDRRRHLADALRDRLGDATAQVRDDPGGGLLARAADGRVVVASTDALVDAALRGLDLESLWSRG